MSIQDWVSGSATKEGDTAELFKEDSTDDMIAALKTDDEHTRSVLGEDEDNEPFGRRVSSDGLFQKGIEYVQEYWYYPLAAVAVTVLVVVMATRMLGGDAPAPQQTSQSPEARQEVSQGPGSGLAEPSGEIQDTGVTLAEPLMEDDSYYLRSGEISWKGKVEQSETGEELTLEGPTAAQFKRAVALPHGEIMTGVFGRAQPDQPIVHGTFHRVTLGEDETTSGTYKAVADQQVLADGNYTDERDGDTVVRTYRETLPQTGEQKAYRVSFEAPAGVPIPTLIGWEPPPLPDTPEAG